MGKLYITADDFGIDLDRDIGICVLAIFNVINSISIIVTNEGSYQRIRRLISIIRKCNPNIELGLHINLTDPQLSLFNLTEICRKENHLSVSNSKILFYENSILNNIEFYKVRSEIDNQLRIYTNIIGRLPNHVDGHNHCHITNVAIFSYLHDLCRKYNIHRIRIPREKLNIKEFLKYKKVYDIELDKDLLYLIRTMRENALSDILLYESLCKKLTKESSCFCALCKEYEFFGTTYGHIRKIKYLIENIHTSSGIQELMIHPGFYWPLIKHNTPFSNLDRQRELFNIIVAKIYWRLNVL